MPTLRLNGLNLKKRYRQELMSNPALSELKKTIGDKAKVTLIYSSRDETHNNAVVLRNVLMSDHSLEQI